MKTDLLKIRVKTKINYRKSFNSYKEGRLTILLVDGVAYNLGIGFLNLNTLNVDISHYEKNLMLDSCVIRSVVHEEKTSVAITYDVQVRVPETNLGNITNDKNTSSILILNIKHIIIPLIISVKYVTVPTVIPLTSLLTDCKISENIWGSKHTLEIEGLKFVKVFSMVEGKKNFETKIKKAVLPKTVLEHVAEKAEEILKKDGEESLETDGAKLLRNYNETIKNLENQ